MRPGSLLRLPVECSLFGHNWGDRDNGYLLVRKMIVGKRFTARGSRFAAPRQAPWEIETSLLSRFD
jgi:hypothetical protein